VSASDARALAASFVEAVCDYGVASTGRDWRDLFARAYRYS
jgi:hypothetical protein